LIGVLKKYHPVPSIVLGLFIFILCLIPGKSFPDMSWAAAVAPDKWVHAILYACWALVYEWSKPLNSKIHSLWIILLMLGFGGFIEIFQENVSANRRGEWLDLAADGIGLVLGYLFSLKSKSN
jgi:VanZ family protein